MLLDTSGLLSYLDVTDPQHTTARRLFATSPVRLSHSYVLAELVALATARRLPRESPLAFVGRLQESPNIQIVWVSEALHRDAFALLRERLDKTYSLCDAVSFLLMEARGLMEALTTDRHFEQAGFRRLLAE
jgi:predicted nucleic acid-binding protein